MLDPRVSRQAWAIWFRGGLQPGGRWEVWEQTTSRTRRDAIDYAIDNGFAGIQSDADWRRLRRRGVVKAARTLLVARLPDAEEDDAS